MNYNFLLSKLRDIREDNNLRQIDVANMLNVERSNYTKWETKQVIIPLKKLNLFCNLFNVSMNYVIGFSTKNTYISYNKDLNIDVISKRIKSIRKKLNLTQKELANVIKCDRSIISDYENGKTLILTAFAYQLCKEYNISMDWLCGRSDDINIK